MEETIQDGLVAAPARTRQRKSRGKGIRKTTGCITCRRRHVKCDELRPRCSRCEKGSHTCLYSNVGRNMSHHGFDNGSNRSLDNRHKRDGLDEVGSETGLPPGGSHATQNASLGFTNTNTESWQRAEAVLAGSPPVSFVSATGRSEINSKESNTQLTGSDRNNDRSMPVQHAEDANIPVGPFVSSPEGLSVYSAMVHSIGSNVGVEDFGPRPSAVTHLSYDVAISRWFDLLATDADLDPSKAYGGLEELQDYDNPSPEANAGARGLVGTSYEGFPVAAHHRTLSSTSSSLHLKERDPTYDASKASEKQQWTSSEPLVLQQHEHTVFQNFVQHISQWMDLFDPCRNFSTLVPHLAMHNTGLLKAILALSARHLSLNPSPHALTHNRNDALQYYSETLHFVARAMQYDTYKTSLELLATALIVSTYEMLDGSGQDWERHLQGVFFIQRSQVIHGDSKGLKQAVWWHWLSQDIWAAFRENRKTFTFWKPVRTYDDMNPQELAVRSVFLIARVIDYCAREEVERCGGDITIRIWEASRLTETLEEWHQYLTAEFNSLPWRDKETVEVFQPIWIHPPAFAVAMQLYNAAQLLLLINKPSKGGLKEFLWQANLTQKYVAKICGIARTLSDYASSILSSQCVFIAGTCVKDVKQRDFIIENLRTCRERTGWPIKPLEIELQNLWSGDDSARGSQ